MDGDDPIWGRANRPRGGSDGRHKPASNGTAYGGLRVLSLDDLEAIAPRDYFLKGILSPGECSLWVGPPKCGKSFLMLHVSYLLALGRPVFGRRVKPARVLYLAAEGEAGIGNRLKAIRDKYGPAPGFSLVAQPLDLLHVDGQLGDLMAAVEGCDAQLVVVDTLNRVLAGGDENSSADMGQFVANLGELRYQTNAHVAVVHHGTKDSRGGNPRGHSSLSGAADALVEVVKLEDGSRTATLVFAKDDADGMRIGFRLASVNLGTDSDGDAVTTLLVEEIDTPAKAPRAERIFLSKGDQVALDCLDRAMADSPIEITTETPGDMRTAARMTDWRAIFYRVGRPGDDADSKRKAFNRARDSLLAKKAIAAQDDFIWRPDKL